MGILRRLKPCNQHTVRLSQCVLVNTTTLALCVCLEGGVGIGGRGGSMGNVCVVGGMVCVFVCVCVCVFVRVCLSVVCL